MPASAGPWRRNLPRTSTISILAGRDLEELQALAADLNLRHNVSARAERVDVLNFDALESALAACIAPAGDSLEGVVLCTGYLGDPETARKDLNEARRILDTNFTGSALALNVLANHFEQKRKGFICALSSVAGDRGRQSNYLYGSAKGGLTTYLQGLRNRLYHSGVHVITVKPGFVDTRMVFGKAKLPLVASTRGRGAGYLPCREAPEECGLRSLVLAGYNVHGVFDSRRAV